MGYFCSFRSIGVVNSAKLIHMLDAMERSCSSGPLQEKCSLNIKFTERNLSLDVLLDESKKKVCSFILDKRDEMPTNFTMIFSCRNKILLMEGIDLRKLLNQIPGGLDAANNFSTLTIDFLVADTDKEASVSSTDNELFITLKVKQHPVLPSDRDPVGIFPTSVVIPSEVLYPVLRRFTGELEQLVGHTLSVEAENGRLLLSISGSGHREQLDGGNGIQVQGQQLVSATYDLYKVWWYLTSMLRREHGVVLVNVDAVFMSNTREHKLSFKVRSESGEALGTLIVY
ncbi:hypothetical protein SLEP1_g2803 [Rubroshorea leprosula]|uniref:Checkpoint protein n=1 Tax=Rubroshorea leprosula TaxID=152421 RepID=A0AAV5HIC8_9ROSI|nr:hypothetical protein SLEP1_g2803 [Rubroshorea leprosula]